MQRVDLQLGISKPVTQLADLGAIAVIQMLACAEDFDQRDSGVPHAVQPYGGQAVIHEKVRREGALHVDVVSISQTEGG